MKKTRIRLEGHEKLSREQMKQVTGGNTIASCVVTCLDITDHVTTECEEDTSVVICQAIGSTPYWCKCTYVSEE